MLTKPGFDNAAIFKPFKLNLWGAIFLIPVSLLAISKVFVILFTAEKEINGMNPWKIMPGILGALIDQPGKVFGKILPNPSHVNSFTVFIAWNFWLLIGFAVGQIYYRNTVFNFGKL